MADFHFIRPWWLIALVLVFVIAYLLKRLQLSSSGWQQIIPTHLAAKLIDGGQQKQSFSLFAPLILTVLAILALAGPTWEKLPQPVFSVQKGAVIIMDMSNSMYATDISPNRLTRARYKAIDLLDKLTEGDTGLISYAGDSFVISPLTEDVNNIKLLLPALSPELMPVQGSNPLLAITMANEMLLNAGYVQGDIYWFTDGVDQYDTKEIQAFSQTINHKINILGIGTISGAPIKMPSGELLKDNSGSIVIPRLPNEALNSISQQARGNYRVISNDSSDIEGLLTQDEHQVKDQEQAQLSEGDQWQEAGPYLVLLMLPLLLTYFRRGHLIALLPFCFYFAQPQPSYAQSADQVMVKQAQQVANQHQAEHSPTTENAEQPAKVEKPSTAQRLWQNLWQTQDQQAQQHYNQKNYNEAAKQFTQPLWQGSAQYKAGNYEQALEAFKQSDSAQALYNQGNSLAKLQKLDDAIKAYDQALAKQPNFEAAKANKALLEKLKEQQQQQNPNDEQNKDSDQDKQDQEQQQNQDQNQDQQSQDQNNEDNQQSQQDQQQDGEDSQQEQSDEQKQENEQAKPSESEENSEQQASELTEAEQAEQEQQQKYQQLLNKVTDDPYLLLRNKMQLEYQKRRHQNSGVTKKW